MEKVTGHATHSNVPVVRRLWNIGACFQMPRLRTLDLRGMRDRRDDAGRRRR